MDYIIHEEAATSGRLPPSLPFGLGTDLPITPCGRMGSQVHFGVLGADFHAAQWSYWRALGLRPSITFWSVKKAGTVGLGAPSLLPPLAPLTPLASEVWGGGEVIIRSPSFKILLASSEIIVWAFEAHIEAWQTMWGAYTHEHGQPPQTGSRPSPFLPSCLGRRPANHSHAVG